MTNETLAERADRWQREETCREMAAAWFGEWLRSGKGHPAESEHLRMLAHRARELWGLTHPGKTP